ncbi:hypothetical protein ATCC90586_000054 [Pythium insidiosum]|nr:hypothetical protein ATCC90586_000054 [Pythium insidiosum]
MLEGSVASRRGGGGGGVTRRKEPAGDARDASAEDPDAKVEDGPEENDGATERRAKMLYGKSKQEMHAAYLDRVAHWMKTAPTQNWAKDYDKETYSRAYVPRERHKVKEIGAPVVKTGPYSPRAVYKGGGEHVKTLVDASSFEDQGPRDEYREPIRFVEKGRTKEKEIQPPLAVPGNKRLECAHYFVEDVISGSTTLERPTTHQQGARSSRQLSPLRPHGESPENNHRNWDPPPTTAEYVALPQWRTHAPGKWVGGVFVSTVSSSNPHTAQRRGISGTPHPRTVLISEPFVPPHKRHPLPAKEQALLTREHERRAQTAAATLRETRSPRRQDKKYFASMWTEPGSPSPAKELAVTTPSRPSMTSPGKTSSNNGRALVLQLRMQTQRSQRHRLRQYVIPSAGGSPNAKSTHEPQQEQV